VKPAAWAVPRDWASERAFILGGGRSLQGFDASILRGRGRVIGVKESGLTLAPWADVLYWCDPQWTDANWQRLDLHTGPHKICRSQVHERYSATPPALADKIKASLVAAGVKHLPRDPCNALSIDPTKTGEPVDTGGSAINLAHLFGATTIILLGFDMRTTGHWHERTLREPEAKHYERFIPPIERMAARLRDLGVRVINCTPGSALTCFPFQPLDEVLAMDFTPHVRQLFQLRGRLSTFTPAGGSAANCRVIRQGGGEPVQMGPIRVVVDRTRFHVRRAEVAAPDAGDVLTFAGDAYTIDAVQPVERDADKQLWCLETSWGAAVTYRSTTGSGATQSPPQGSTFAVKVAALAGAPSITIDAPFAVGRLLAGDTFTIAGNATVYTVAAPVTAASSTFTGVTFTPVLAANAAEDAAVTFTFSRDYSVRAAIAGYAADEVAGGVQVGDRRVVILEDALDDAGVSDTPKATDRLTFEGRQFTVISATALYGDGVPVAWDLQVRG
jgi:hypothetical protein